MSRPTANVLQFLNQEKQSTELSSFSHQIKWQPGDIQQYFLLSVSLLKYIFFTVHIMRHLFAAFLELYNRCFVHHCLEWEPFILRDIWRLKGLVYLQLLLYCRTRFTLKEIIACLFLWYLGEVLCVCKSLMLYELQKVFA